MGIINLASVHVDKIQERGFNSINSGALILFLIISLVITLIQGPTGEVSQFFFNYVQIPIETSIMAMLTFSLAYAIVRLLQRRLTAFSVLFVISVWFTLLGSGPVFGLQLPIPIIGDLIEPLLTEVLAVSGSTRHSYWRGPGHSGNRITYSYRCRTPLWRIVSHE